MALITTQQINKYYSNFKAVDVTFTNDVIRATGLKAKETHLKLQGDFWPCFIYSSSLSGAKVILNLTKTFHEKLKSANSLISLRFSFLDAEKKKDVAFFVSAKVTGFTAYDQKKPNLMILTLNYTQQPPDDLIYILGSLLETNLNAQKRSEERIPITEENQRKLDLKSRTSVVTIDQIPRKCILKDLSFSGAQAIIPGIGKFLVEKPAFLRIELDERKQVYNIRGKVVRFEEVSGRKDISSIALLFDTKSIPIEYKMLINEFLRTKRKAG